MSVTLTVIYACIFFAVSSGADIRVQSKGAGKADIDLIKDKVKGVERTAELYFGEGYTMLSERIKCQILVYSVENKKANRGSATLESQMVGNHVTGILHLLAPAAYPDGMKSMGGQVKGSEDYTLRLLGHELLSLYLSALSRTRAKGWDYYSAPNWFTQGSQEYLASMCLEKELRAQIFANYFRVTEIKLEPKITTNNPYSGGLVIMKFIADTYGESQILNIIRSEADSFDIAFEEAVGAKDKFMASFQKWRAKKMN